MKTTIEMHGFEIVIEETEAGLTVSALKDGDVVEEFSLEGGEDNPEMEEGKGEEIQGFDEFGQGEEEDFEGEEDMDDSEVEEELEEEDEEEEDMDEEEEEESKLESFQSFINKKRK